MRCHIIDEEEAIRRAVECINEDLDLFLTDIVRTKEMLREARTISDVMEVKKFIISELVFNFPLEWRESPFCWLYTEETDTGDLKFPREKEDCVDCEYAKEYGIVLREVPLLPESTE